MDEQNRVTNVLQSIVVKPLPRVSAKRANTNTIPNDPLTPEDLEVIKTVVIVTGVGRAMFAMLEVIAARLDVTAADRAEIERRTERLVRTLRKFESFIDAISRFAAKSLVAEEALNGAVDSLEDAVLVAEVEEVLAGHR